MSLTMGRSVAHVRQVLHFSLPKAVVCTFMEDKQTKDHEMKDNELSMVQLVICLTRGDKLEN